MPDLIRSPTMEVDVLGLPLRESFRLPSPPKDRQLPLVGGVLGGCYSVSRAIRGDHAWPVRSPAQAAGAEHCGSGPGSEMDRGKLGWLPWAKWRSVNRPVP